MNQPDQQPTLETPRLRLRPLNLSDAPRIQVLAGDEDVARTTSRIPHPYPEGAAREWIEAPRMEEHTPFAIAERATDDLIGGIGFSLQEGGLIAEIGFWVGKPYWNQGFCTEAAREIVRYCFEDLGVNRVHAGHFAGNGASGRVQEKIGMRREGWQRWGVSRFGEMKDLVLYGMTRPDWLEAKAAD